MLLLEYNADTTVVNGSGQTAKEVTYDKEIRNMLEGKYYGSQHKKYSMIPKIQNTSRNSFWDARIDYAGLLL